MAKKKAATKPSDKVGMTPERAAEIAKETEAALASSRKSEADRIARVGAAGVKGTERTAVKVDVNPGVKFKKKITRDTTTGRAKVADVEARVSGEEDQGPSAAPKPQSNKARAKRTMISPQEKMRKKGLRPAKNRELAKGIMAVTVATETPKKNTSKKRKTTRSGKPLDPTTGKIDTSKIKPGRAAKVDGKVVRVDSANVEDLKKAAVTTVLPKAEAPAPEKPRTLAPGAGPLREQVYIDESRPAGEKAVRKLKGLAVPHKVIAPAVNQAIQHIDNMAATKGTSEYHGHVQAFNTLHPTILDMDQTIHHALGAMAHHTIYPKPNSASVITQLKSGIADRLSEGKRMETQRAQRQRGN